MKYVCTLVVVDDVLRSRKLYEEILKLKVIADFGEYNAAFEGGLALYRKALYQGIMGDRRIQSQSNNFELFFEENDLLSIQRAIKDNGFEIIHEVREEPWRQLSFRFYDYDKNVIVVAENMDYTINRLLRNGLNIGEIAKATGMPVEEIQKAIKE